MAAIEIEKPDTDLAELIFPDALERMSQADLLYKLVHEYDARIMSRNMSSNSCLYNLNVRGIALLLYYTDDRANRLAGRGADALDLLKEMAEKFQGAQLLDSSEA